VLEDYFNLRTYTKGDKQKERKMMEEMMTQNVERE